MPRTWTVDEIVELIERDDRFVGRCLVVLFNRQTSEEQASAETRELNGRGFNARDAEFGTSLARWFMQNSFLTPRQLGHARKMAKRYRKQLTEHANRQNEVPVG